MDCRRSQFRKRRLMYPDIASDKEFPPFSAVHLLVLAILVAIGATLILLGRKGGGYAERQRVFLGWLLLAQYPLELALTFGWGRFSVHQSIPLHMCDFVFVVGGLALLLKKPLLMDLTYFWGAAGTSQSLFTPVLMGAAFPHPGFFYFFLSHGLGVISAFYVVLAMDHRPTLGSVWIALLCANVYAALTACVNAALGTNYAYLCHKPEEDTLISLLGPWPWSILSREFVAAAFFLILWAPFGICARRRSPGAVA